MADQHTCSVCGAPHRLTAPRTSGLTPSEIGRKAARARWGPQRRVRLDQLDPDARAAILAAIEAAK